MDSLIQSLKKFELGDSGIDDIINKLNKLSTENDEWEILVKNYSKLKYLKNMESQLIHSKELIKINPAITLSKIKKKIFKKFNTDISTSYLFYIIKYTLKLTHKQLKFKYYPGKKLATLKEDKINFYKEVIKQGNEI